MNIGVIAALFPVEISIAVATPEMYGAALFPEEQARIANAVQKRREQFAAGRNAARQALRQLGLFPCAIAADPRGAPLWPDGIAGSITHCDGFCCAVIAPQSYVRSIGIDAEPKAPLDARIARVVCRPEEATHFAALPPLAATNWVKLAFSAKEAFYKCFYPLTGVSLDFRDVTVRFTIEPGAATGGFAIALVTPVREQERIATAITGRWAVDDLRVYTAAISLAASGLPEAASL